MLWIALFLPELPLQTAQRRLPADTRASLPLPVAVSEGPDLRPVICALNEAAAKHGVCKEQTVAMARALAGNLVVVPRDMAREHDVLRQAATIACRFTPNVSLAPDAVLLEISASLALFGGLGALLNELRAGLRELGYHACAGVAPTPLAAWLFAKARASGSALRGTRQTSDLAERLADLPLALFEWDSPVVASLAHLGVMRVRDLRQLPRDGVVRRFGAQVLDDLDRASGRLPDPRACFALPETFATRVEFMQEVEHFEGLRFPLRRMLGELENFLAARGAATQEWRVTFEHTRTTRTAFAVKTRDPARDRARWETLLGERVAREPLSGFVSAIVIACRRIEAYVPVNESWLPDRGAAQGHWNSLAERLTARLGEGSVLSIAVRDDHRPERAWHSLGDGIAQRPRATAKAPSRSTRPAALQAPPACPPRPAWLLENPRALITRNTQPHYQGALDMLAGPERIESGWWDGQPARRDYFVARNRNGETLWIYRELKAPDRWYLHGFFS